MTKRPVPEVTASRPRDNSNPNVNSITHVRTGAAYEATSRAIRADWHCQSPIAEKYIRSRLLTVVSFYEKPLPIVAVRMSVRRSVLSTEDTMRSKRTIAIAALSAANIRSFARPSDWLCTHLMGSGYSLQTNTKPEQGLPRPD
jgi:hypothetical protein